MNVRESISELRKWQRHHLLRKVGEDGHVLPENLKISKHLDVVIHALVIEADMHCVADGQSTRE